MCKKNEVNVTLKLDIQEDKINSEAKTKRHSIFDVKKNRQSDIEKIFKLSLYADIFIDETIRHDNTQIHIDNLKDILDKVDTEYSLNYYSPTIYLKKIKNSEE